MRNNTNYNDEYERVADLTGRSSQQQGDVVSTLGEHANRLLSRPNVDAVYLHSIVVINRRQQQQYLRQPARAYCSQPPGRSH